MLMNGSDIMKSIKICAHRGASAYAPENTMPAFRLAAEQRADSIELDVHLTKDNVIAVSHDETIDRCSDGSGRIADMYFSDLEKFNFNKNYPELGFVKIPSLREVYEFAKASGLCVNVEIKGGIGSIEPGLAALARQMDMTEQVYYCSFSLDALINIKKAEPSCIAGYLYGEAQDNVWDTCVCNGIDAVHPWYGQLTEEIISKCHANGLIVRPWVIDDEGDMAKFFSYGIDEVITDRPDTAFRVLSETGL